MQVRRKFFPGCESKMASSHSSQFREDNQPVYQTIRAGAANNQVEHISSMTRRTGFPDCAVRWSTRR